MTDPDQMADDLQAARDVLSQVKADRAAQPDLYPADFDWAIAVLEEALGEVGRLRGLLARLEWPETIPGAGQWHICPVCSNHRDQGHDPDCWLDAELQP